MRQRGRIWPWLAAAFLILNALPQRAASSAEDAVLGRVIAHATARANGDAPNAFDRSVYRGEMRDLPVGVFDSGIGGLTVLEAILAIDAFDNDTLRPGPDGRRDFESERFVYFGDRTVQAVDRYLRVRSDHRWAHLPKLWLGERGGLTEDGIRARFEVRCDEAGLPRIYPHQLRHTWANDFLANGAALDGLWGLYSGNPFAILGVGAMFLMIGAGVYELTAANGEKKPIKDLLKE